MKDLTERFVQSAKAVDGQRADYPDAKERGLACVFRPVG
jgi:hypothetical protein